MASQEDQVEGEEKETTPAEDTAKFSGAWDDFDGEDASQPAPAAGREGTSGEADQGEGEAGQGEAQAGQPDAGTTPGADAGEASREVSDDVLANADPRLKAHVEHLEAEKLKAENLARSNGGRLAKALNELAAATQAQAELSEEEKAKRAKVREDYDEVADALLGPVERLESEVGKLRAAEVARAEAAVVVALEANFDALTARHPDLAAIVRAPEYAAWIDGQPPSVQRTVQENAKAVVNAADAAKVFDDFKRETGWGLPPQPNQQQQQVAERRSDQLDAGRTASGVSQPGVRSDAKPNGGTFDEAWDGFDRDDKRKAASRR